MNIYRDKLINAVLFFAKETSNLNLTKLMKLLYFLDFEHFNETGYPSVGLEYESFPQGPVPKKFWLEIKDEVLPDDLNDKISLRVRPWEKGKVVEFLPKPSAKIDFEVFTPREQKILNKLAYIYKDASATDMSNISHEAEMPWEKTKNEKGLYEQIDYILAHDDKSPISIDDAKESLHDHFSITKAFGIGPTN